MPDFRDRWLFVAGVEMNWLVIPRVLQRELFALVRQVGGWTEGTTPSKVHAVCRTAREAAAGKRVAFAGVDGTLAIASETKPSVSGWRSRARRSREIKIRPSSPTTSAVGATASAASNTLGRPEP